MCNGKILYLDEAWDAMPTEGKEPLKNPKLIHYNLFQKPWCYDNIQYEEYFWKYAKDSGYYEDSARIAFTTAETLLEKAENAKNAVNMRFTNIYKKF